MIRSIKVTGGFASELPYLKGKTFEFKPGLNILFGPNGCGKSSLMRIIAGYSNIPSDAGGWSKQLHYRKQWGWKDKPPFPQCFQKNCPTRDTTAEMDWDASPTFMYDAARIDARGLGQFSWDEENSGDGMTDIQDQMGQMFGHPSQGQLSEHKLSKLVKKLQSPPLFFLDLPEVAKMEDEEKEFWRSALDYYKTLSHQAACPTVLLDEPDRSLSVENQIAIWTRFLPNIASRYQVIVASHSPIALGGAIKAHYIDVMGDGYVEQTKGLLNTHFSGVVPDLTEIFQRQREREEKDRKETAPAKSRTIPSKSPSKPSSAQAAPQAPSPVSPRKRAPRKKIDSTAKDNESKTDGEKS